MFGKHTSKSFDASLDAALQTFLTMGHMAVGQVSRSMQALAKNDAALATDVIDSDAKINAFERDIDEQVVNLVARRQPTANDLRFIICLSKGVVDIERIGDEAVKIARLVLQNSSLLAEGGRSEHDYQHQALADKVRLMVVDALEAFRHQDARLAFEVMQMDEVIDSEYRAAIDVLRTQELDNDEVIQVLWVLRALERIGDHARNLAEFVVYLGSGTDVRHTSFSDVEEAVEVAQDRFEQGRADKSLSSADE
ncbi:phosphate transport system regulatory protein PhoU [Moraxella caviae]|uniref:Phosphate-specific transport system accessory protein PhoU n=1 Tax=Moraxella caviae TaxID=34060 RepID=A0A1T0AC42_9GAMM|nr:phosphate signaling complex protein PhoU [Moraxella caviae]OOR92891.1 phosphate transport system regulatory protein PhoU [Moraxella caviae]STZ10370.1 Phosphate transport system protein phoU [Moraxella caviae]VEW12587.1 Phosphate transport system protein phoU [Moraxella caviae]